MTGLLAEPTDDDLRAEEVRGHCREQRAAHQVLADNLCGSIAMAEARGEDTRRARMRLAVILDYEHALAKRATGNDKLPRYEPRWPSRREEAA